MNLRSLAVDIKKRLPKRAQLGIQKIYLTTISILGPNYFYWQLRRRYKKPRTYSEKLFHKMAFDRDPNLTMLVDKILVRNYVRNTIGEKYLAKSYLETYNVKNIDWTSLPREYVCKVNHGCGGIIFVAEFIDQTVKLPDMDSVEPWQRIQIHPENVDPERMVAILKFWLSHDYTWDKRRTTPEWAYKDVKRGVIIEELIRGQDGRFPIDYKFFVVGGAVQLISAAAGRIEGDLRSTIYKGEWEPSDLRFKSQGPALRAADPPIAPPRFAREMVEISVKLASITDSARVDLYATDDRIIFGEITIYPSAGQSPFMNESDNAALGEKWHQVSRYKS